MILGHGVDLVDIERMRRIIERYGDHFISRYFGEHEITTAAKYNDSAPFFASRFAAKEAFSKAVGTGFIGFGPKDVVVLREDLSPPRLTFSDKVEKKVPGIKPDDFILSISHERGMAIASVIWRKNP